MADVYTYINQTGTITVDAGVILEQVAAEYQAVFGTDLIVPTSLTPQGASTPQGLLIVLEALARIAAANNNAALANQINPNLAGGVYLDSLCALTGLERATATPTITLATLQGVEGTIIPAGSQAVVNGTDYVFETIAQLTIPPGGTLTNIEFQSVIKGAIPCPANSLIIKSSVIGWTSIVSNIEGILGTETQTDEQLRYLRNYTLGLQGASTAQSIIGGVSVVPNVSSVRFLENYLSSTQTIENISMVANSIYVCADGGYNGLTSNNASFSTVIGTIGGTPTTVIPAGSQAQSDNFIFQTIESVTIGGGGTVNTTFQATVPGAIPCPASSLTTIVTPVAGWNTITNAADGSLGTIGNINGQSSSVLATITGVAATVIPAGSQASSNGNVFQTLEQVTIGVGGTVDVNFYSIYTGQIPCPAATLTTIVTPVVGWTSITNANDGTLGKESGVAQAMVAKKSAGSAFNNTQGVSPSQGVPINTIVTVPYSNQLMLVKYDNPQEVLIYVIVSAKLTAGLTNAIDSIKATLISYAQGNINGYQGLTVGQNVSSFEMAGAITSTFPQVFVQNITIGKAPNPSTSTEITIEAYQKAILTNASISVVIS